MDHDRPQEMAGEPAREIEEVEILHLGGQSSDLTGERDEQHVAQHRLVVDERVEGISSQDLRLGRVERHRRRGPSSAVEQRQLPEEAARADGGEDRRLGPVVRRDRDLHGALGHEEERVSGIASMEDRLALAEPAWP